MCVSMVVERERGVDIHDSLPNQLVACASNSLFSTPGFFKRKRRKNLILKKLWRALGKQLVKNLVEMEKTVTCRSWNRKFAFRGPEMLTNPFGAQNSPSLWCLHRDLTGN